VSRSTTPDSRSTSSARSSRTAASRLVQSEASPLQQPQPGLTRDVSLQRRTRSIATVRRFVALVAFLAVVGCGCSSAPTASVTPPSVAQVTVTTDATTTTLPSPSTVPVTTGVPKQTTTTIDNLPGSDANCGQNGLCEAKATCAAWAWSDQYIQDATNEDNLFIDLRLQAGSDNPVSTNSRAGQNNSPYIALTTDSGNAVFDSDEYQSLSDKVNEIDTAINNIPGSQGNDQGQLQQVSDDSESLGNWCSEYAG